MARGVALTQLITDLRAEIGQSTSAIVGLQERPQLVRLIQRTQERLSEQYEWTFLNVQRDIILKAGQRYYDFPSDMKLEHVKEVKVKYNTQLLPVVYGIGPHEYNQMDPDQLAASGYFDITGGSAAGGNQVTLVTIAGIDIQGAAVAWATSNAATATAVAAQINSYTSFPEYTAVANGNRVIITAAASEGSSANGRAIVVNVGGNVTAGTPVNLIGGTTCSRVDPVRKWQSINTGAKEQIEVWPVPASNGIILRVWGVRDLLPLVNDNDVCDLDGILIVLVAAAEKRAGQKDGDAKAKAAVDYLISLRANAKKTGSFKIGESAAGNGPRRTGIIIRVAGAA